MMGDQAGETEAEVAFVHSLPSYESRLLSELQRQWLSCSLCDLLLVVRGREMHVHSCVVSAFCPTVADLLLCEKGGEVSTGKRDGGSVEEQRGEKLLEAGRQVKVKKQNEEELLEKDREDGDSLDNKGGMEIDTSLHPEKDGQGDSSCRKSESVGGGLTEGDRSRTAETDTESQSVICHKQGQAVYTLMLDFSCEVVECVLSALYTGVLKPKAALLAELLEAAEWLRAEELVWAIKEHAMTQKVLIHRSQLLTSSDKNINIESKESGNADIVADTDLLKTTIERKQERSQNGHNNVIDKDENEIFRKQKSNYDYDHEGDTSYAEHNVSNANPIQSEKGDQAAFNSLLELKVDKSCLVKDEEDTFALENNALSEYQVSVRAHETFKPAHQVEDDRAVVHTEMEGDQEAVQSQPITARDHEDCNCGKGQTKEPCKAGSCASKHMIARLKRELAQLKQTCHKNKAAKKLVIPAVPAAATEAANEGNPPNSRKLRKASSATKSVKLKLKTKAGAALPVPVTDAPVLGTGRKKQKKRDASGSIKNNVIEEVEEGDAMKQELDFLMGSATHVKCRRCGEKFNSLDLYHEHVNHHPTFTCGECGMEFLRKFNLTRHVRYSHEGASHLTCKLCDTDSDGTAGTTAPFKARMETEFRRHALEVHKVKEPFTCPHQGCLFRSWKYDRVIRHQQIHNEEKLFVCDKCGQAFSQQCGLISHQRACYQLQEFLCDLCGQSFNHAQSMRSHRRVVHFGEKRFKCSVCTNSFSDHRNLRRHMRIHDNSFPYACPACKQKYRHSNSLKAHMAAKHRDLPPEQLQLPNPQPRNRLGGSSFKRHVKVTPSLLTPRGTSSDTAVSSDDLLLATDSPGSSLVGAQEVTSGKARGRRRRQSKNVETVAHHTKEYASLSMASTQQHPYFIHNQQHHQQQQQQLQRHPVAGLMGDLLLPGQVSHDQSAFQDVASTGDLDLVMDSQQASGLGPSLRLPEFKLTSAGDMDQSQSTVASSGKGGQSEPVDPMKEYAAFLEKQTSLYSVYPGMTAGPHHHHQYLHHPAMSGISGTSGIAHSDGGHLHLGQDQASHFTSPHNPVLLVAGFPPVSVASASSCDVSSAVVGESHPESGAVSISSPDGSGLSTVVTASSFSRNSSKREWRGKISKANPGSGYQHQHHAVPSLSEEAREASSSVKLLSPPPPPSIAPFTAPTLLPFSVGATSMYQEAPPFQILRSGAGSAENQGSLSLRGPQTPLSVKPWGVALRAGTNCVGSTSSSVVFPGMKLCEPDEGAGNHSSGIDLYVKGSSGGGGLLFDSELQGSTTTLGLRLPIVSSPYKEQQQQSYDFQERAANLSKSGVRGESASNKSLGSHGGGNFSADLILENSALHQPNMGHASHRQQTNPTPSPIVSSSPGLGQLPGSSSNKNYNSNNNSNISSRSSCNIMGSGGGVGIDLCKSQDFHIKPDQVQPFGLSYTRTPQQQQHHHHHQQQQQQHTNGATDLTQTASNILTTSSDTFMSITLNGH